jgi:quinolinate synthase
MQPEGTIVAVGTESNMVKRLASEKDKIKIIPLKVAYCDDMAKVTLEKLALCLEMLSEEYRIEVAEDIAADALKALKRMLEV